MDGLSGEGLDKNLLTIAETQDAGRDGGWTAFGYIL